MSLSQEKPYTIDYIYALPDKERAELIDGRIYNMAPPSPKHQSIIGELFFSIRNHIDAKGGSCKPYVAPFAVFLNEDSYTYVEPDISVIGNPEKIDSRGCNGAPDWIIEIVSPSSRQMDYLIKLFKYRQAGVREYWIVDPDKDRITVYTFDPEAVTEYNFADVIKAGIFEDLTIDFSELSI